MKVYAYFDSCCQTAAAEPTLALWRDSWEKMGWETAVLREAHAKAHPLYPAFSRSVKAFPSVNGPGFDYHAFMRWLAAASLDEEVVLTTEPDVINYGMRPWSDDYAHAWATSKVAMFGPVPCMLAGTPAAFAAWCQSVVSHELQPADHFQGRPHISDQDWAARYGIPAGRVHRVVPNPHCSEVFADPAWRSSPCVHYGTPYMAEADMIPKHRFIPYLRPLP